MGFWTTRIALYSVRGGGLSSVTAVTASLFFSRSKVVGMGSCDAVVLLSGLLRRVLRQAPLIVAMTDWSKVLLNKPIQCSSEPTPLAIAVMVVGEANAR